MGGGDIDGETEGLHLAGGFGFLLAHLPCGETWGCGTAVAVADFARLTGAPAGFALGKALNDPVKGITALSKVVVTFTEDQKKMIKTMVETGDAAGAETVILDDLAKEFGVRRRVEPDQDHRRDSPGVIKGIITPATALIKGDWSGAWNAIKDVFSIWNGLTSSLTNYISRIGNAFGGIKNTVTGAFSAAGTWHQGCRQGCHRRIRQGQARRPHRQAHVLEGPGEPRQGHPQGRRQVRHPRLHQGPGVEVRHVEKSLGGLTNKVSQTQFDLNPPTASFDVGTSSTGGRGSSAPVSVVASVEMPRELVVVDVDGTLIGRMQVAAGQVMNGKVPPERGPRDLVKVRLEERCPLVGDGTHPQYVRYHSLLPRSLPS